MFFYWNKIVSSISYKPTLLSSSPYLFPEVKYFVLVKYILWCKEKQEKQQKTKGFVTLNIIFNIFVNSISVVVNPELVGRKFQATIFLTITLSFINRKTSLNIENCAFKWCTLFSMF